VDAQQEKIAQAIIKIGRRVKQVLHYNSHFFGTIEIAFKGGDVPTIKVHEMILTPDRPVPGDSVDQLLRQLSEKL
jgi:hypothetical protein